MPQQKALEDGFFNADRQLTQFGRCGYKVIPPPIGSTVTTLANGAEAENVKGVAYFHFGGAYYRPFYSGSSVIYEVVAKPS